MKTNILRKKIKEIFYDNHKKKDTNVRNIPHEGTQRKHIPPETWIDGQIVLKTISKYTIQWSMVNVCQSSM